jgi:hypothetical protein
MTRDQVETSLEDRIATIHDDRQKSDLLIGALLRSYAELRPGSLAQYRTQLGWMKLIEWHADTQGQVLGPYFEYRVLDFLTAGARKLPAFGDKYSYDGDNILGPDNPWSIKRRCTRLNDEIFLGMRVPNHADPEWSINHIPIRQQDAEYHWAKHSTRITKKRHEREEEKRERDEYQRAYDARPESIKERADREKGREEIRGLRKTAMLGFNYRDDTEPGPEIGRGHDLQV